MALSHGSLFAFADGTLPNRLAIQLHLITAEAFVDQTG